MITPEIIAYIKAEREKQTPDATIMANLTSNGWSKEDVGEAFRAFPPGGNGAVPKPPISIDELQKYRSHRRLMVFSIIAVLILIVYVVLPELNGRGSYINSGTILILFLYILVAYGAAYIATKNSYPYKSTTQNVMDIIGSVIGTIVISALLAFGIFFAVCLFGLGGGF